MILEGDLRVIRAVGLDLPAARWDFAGGINTVPDVGPELIEGLRPGNRPPIPTIAIASSGCMARLVDKR